MSSTSKAHKSDFHVWLYINLSHIPGRSVATWWLYQQNMYVDWAPEGLAEFLCLASHSQSFGLQNKLAQNFLPGIAVAGEYQNKRFF